MSTIDPDVLPAEVRAVLDRIKVKPILEYVAGRLKITNAAHSEVMFLFAGPSLRKTKLSHLQIGNTELEYLTPPLAGPLAGPGAVAE